MEELEQKVLTEKFCTISQKVSKPLTDLIHKLLQKKPENRPSIKEIIMTEEF